MTPRAVVVGMPGAGKTTTGRRLAKILAVPFADSDDLVVAAAGRSIPELFAAGEDEFRRVESAAVRRALSGFDGVLALGGGALTTGAVREALRECGAPVVLLRAELTTLAERVGAGDTRPLLAGDPVARLAALADERAALYEQVATLSVGTDGRTAAQVASSIAASLHEIGVA
jgi:shikimate kinase